MSTRKWPSSREPRPLISILSQKYSLLLEQMDVSLNPTMQGKHFTQKCIKHVTIPSKENHMNSTFFYRMNCPGLIQNWTNQWDLQVWMNRSFWLGSASVLQIFITFFATITKIMTKILSNIWVKYSIQFWVLCQELSHKTWWKA